MRILVSLMIGLVLSAQTPKPKPQPIQGTQVYPNSPRFQLVQLGEFRSDQYLLDTKTGRLWQIVSSKEGEKLLQRVMFIHGADEFRAEVPEPDIELQATIATRKSSLAPEWDPFKVGKKPPK